MQSTVLRRMVTPLVAGGLAAAGALSWGPPALAAAGTLGYTFEDGTDDLTAPTWLSANAGDPVQSSAAGAVVPWREQIDRQM